MKRQLLLAVLMLAAMVCFTQAMQAFTANELFARAAADADQHLSAEDVITQRDFSLAEYEALQSLSSEDFWNQLEEQIQARPHSLIEKEKETETKKASKGKKAAKKGKKAAKKGKKAAKKGKKNVSKKGKKNASIKGKKNASKKNASKKNASKAKKNKTKKNKTAPAGLTLGDMAVARAEGDTPAELKKAVLNATLFAQDSPYDFIYAHHDLPVVKGTDELHVRAAKYVKKVNKGLIDEGKLIHSEIFRLERFAKKAVEEEDWNEVTLIRRKFQPIADRVKAWKLRKETMLTLKTATSLLIDWEASADVAKAAITRDYVKAQSEKTTKLRALVEKYLKENDKENVIQLKAMAARALKKDLAALQGKAMESFVQKLKQALYKSFGQKKVDDAATKGGLRALKALTGAKFSGVLLTVAGHLPTVGPYVRAGLVNEALVNSSVKYVRRW